MVAQAPEAPPDSIPGTAKPRTPRARHPRGGLRRLLASVTRIANLQVEIWLTQAKLTVMKMALYAALFATAALLGLLAIIFLYIGFFRLLTDVVGLAPVWAYLIYGALHLVVAGVLVLIGTKTLTSKDSEDKNLPPENAPSPAAP